MKHVLGLLIAFSAFMTMTDLAAVTAIMPAQLGFEWQSAILGILPLLCVVGCLTISWAAPVGNCSQSTLVRRIGRIPVLGRYFGFVGIVCATVLLGMLALNVFTSSSIQSLRLPSNTPMSTTIRISQDVGKGVTFRWRGDDVRVFFLKEKRAAVQRAIERESITVEK